MLERFNIGGIAITVALVESWEWNGPPHLEIQTTVSAVIEGQHVTYSVSEVVSDYAGNKEIEALFNEACNKYRFTTKQRKLNP